MKLGEIGIGLTEIRMDFSKSDNPSKSSQIDSLET